MYIYIYDNEAQQLEVAFATLCFAIKLQVLMIGGQWAWGPMCPCYYVQIVQSFFFPFPLSQKATCSRNTKPPLSNLIYKLGNASQTGFSSLACRHEKPVDLHLPIPSKGG